MNSVAQIFQGNECDRKIRQQVDEAHNSSPLRVSWAQRSKSIQYKEGNCTRRTSSSGFWISWQNISCLPFFMVNLILIKKGFILFTKELLGGTLEEFHNGNSK